MCCSVWKLVTENCLPCCDGVLGRPDHLEQNLPQLDLRCESGKFPLDTGLVRPFSLPSASQWWHRRPGQQGSGDWVERSPNKIIGPEQGQCDTKYQVWAFLGFFLAFLSWRALPTGWFVLGRHPGAALSKSVPGKIMPAGYRSTAFQAWVWQQLCEYVPAHQPALMLGSWRGLRPSIVSSGIIFPFQLWATLWAALVFSSAFALSTGHAPFTHQQCCCR